MILLSSTEYSSAMNTSPLYMQRSFQTSVERIIGKKQVCAVAIDPRNGRILALVNPNMAVTKAYPPGSIIKLLTAYAGLKSGMGTREQTIECRNSLTIEGKRLICSQAGGHGKVNLEKAIAQSCNIYFYKLGISIGEQQLLKCFHDFGLGQRTGIPVSNENTGSVPKSFQSRTEIAHAAIGESDRLRVTAIQMAVITAAIVNGGTEYVPRIAKSDKPKVLRRVYSLSGAFGLLRKSMRLAVTEGTAKKAGVSGLSVCGKTGSPATADNPDYRHGWFVGFAPYEKPEIVLVVFNEWGHGGTDAAPIAGKILSAWTRNRISKSYSSSSSSMSSSDDGE
ncbi:MAG: penicillin-binding transpeptidase domain-containing protein [Armatimonadota bacterium]